MIPQVVLKFILPKVKVLIEGLAKKYNLDKMEKLIEYMDNPNDADNKIEALEERLKALEGNSHPPRTFVICENCNKQIKEK